MQNGGAVLASLTPATIQNCTFIANTATGDTEKDAYGQGGAVSSQGGPVKVGLCTFTGNKARVPKKMLCGCGALY